MARGCQGWSHWGHLSGCGSRSREAATRIRTGAVRPLWASAITLRVLLVENLRRIAERIVYSRDERCKADAIANRILDPELTTEPTDGLLKELEQAPLSDAFIADYLSHEWPAVAGCVGVFRIEARGVQLFESIVGDHFTVLGMPLLAVLGALRDLGELPR